MVALAQLTDAELYARGTETLIAGGCRTASLQATAAAEWLYAAVGFRDLGAILEYVR